MGLRCGLILDGRIKSVSLQIVTLSTLGLGFQLLRTTGGLIAKSLIGRGGVLQTVIPLNKSLASD